MLHNVEIFSQETIDLCSLFGFNNPIIAGKFSKKVDTKFCVCYTVLAMFLVNIATILIFLWKVG